MMDWTLEDMVDDLFICSTLTGRRGSHTPFVQYKQKRKRPTPVHRRLGRTQAVLGRVIPGGAPVLGIKMRSLVSLSAHSASYW